MTDLPRERLQSSLGAAYTLERELHGGGMSRVFLARDSVLGRDVVIKVLTSELAEELSTERFAREIRLAAALQEPHIVPLLSAGTTSEGLPYYTMPYVRGESLRRRMVDGPVPLSSAVSILRDVAHALAYAHAEGIIHRDIKPENVLLSSGTAVVTDFGIAKAVSASRTAGTGGITRTGTAIGTPAYMAPEQAAADWLDQRTDLYSWGVLAYELLAGRHPFASRTSPQQLVAAHASEAPPPLTSAAPDVPKHLASLVMACLAKSPDARPKDAHALLAVLETTGERPASSRSSRRARYVVGATLAVLVAGGLALAVPAWRARGAVTSGALPAITVLPFENLSGDSASTYFSDGMTEEMLDVLERARVFRVSSRATTFSYKGRHEEPVSVAARTRADAVLTGSVRRIGNELRVVAELVRGTNGERLWAQTYDRSPSDVLLVQEEIARAIASSLRITLSPRSEPRRVAPAAHDAYLRARQLVNPADGTLRVTRQSVERAIALLEQAVADDSTFALGWAQLGRTYVRLADFVPATTVLPKAKASILRAVQLDPTNADVALSLASILLNGDWNWEASEREYRRALALDPQSAEAHRQYSDLLSALRRGDEALREQSRAHTLEWRQAADTSGLRAKQMGGMASTLAMAGRTAEARRLFEQALRLAPTDPSLNAVAGGWLSTLGDPAGGVRLLEVARPAFGESTPYITWLGYAYGMMGRPDTTRRILADIERRSRTEYFPKDQIAMLYLGLNDRARALRAYEQAIDEHHWWMPYVNNDAWAPSLRADPEFRRLIKRLNVPDASL